MRFLSSFPASRSGSKPVLVLVGAVMIGLVAGIGSLAANEATLGAAKSKMGAIASEMGMTRTRAPQLGDSWSNCGQARAAGVAPLHEGEPGYREALDYDHDGEACEFFQRRRRGSLRLSFKH